MNITTIEDSFEYNYNEILAPFKEEWNYDGDAPNDFFDWLWRNKAKEVGQAFMDAVNMYDGETFNPENFNI